MRSANDYVLANIMNIMLLIIIIPGIKDANGRACNGKKKELVSSRRSNNFLKNWLWQ